MASRSRLVSWLALAMAGALSAYAYAQYARGDLDRRIVVAPSALGVPIGVDLLARYVEGSNICDILERQPIRMTPGELERFLAERDGFFAVARQPDGAFSIERQPGFGSSTLARMAGAKAGCEIPPGRQIGRIGSWAIPMVFMLQILFSSLFQGRNRSKGSPGNKP